MARKILVFAERPDAVISLEGVLSLLSRHGYEVCVAAAFESDETVTDTLSDLCFEATFVRLPPVATDGWIPLGQAVRGCLDCWRFPSAGGAEGRNGHSEVPPPTA